MAFTLLVLVTYSFLFLGSMMAWRTRSYQTALSLMVFSSIYGSFLLLGAIDMLNSVILLLLFLVFIVGLSFGGLLGGISGLVAWLSLMVSLKYGTHLDVQAAYMSVILWLMALGLAIWYKLFPEKRINALSALILSYLPPMGVFFVMSANKLAQYLGILYILLVLVLPSKRIFQRFPSNNWNKVLMVALGAQILIVGILARSPYVLPYALVLWWWYKLTTGGGL